MKVNHDIRIRDVGPSRFVVCRTHEAVLLTYPAPGDIPLTEVMQAVATHRGQLRSVGAARLVRNNDGTYRFDMDDVDLSAAVAGGSDFEIQHHSTGEKFIELTIAVDSIEFDKADVRMLNAKHDGGRETETYRYTTYELDEHRT